MLEFSKEIRKGMLEEKSDFDGNEQTVEQIETDLPRTFPHLKVSLKLELADQ
jgi:hypothetical protein